MESVLFYFPKNNYFFVKK